MMRDNLEKFVQDNRAAFDDAEPAPRILGKVTAQLSAKPRRPVWKLPVFRAAAVILVVLIAALVYRAIEKPSPENTTEETVYDDTIIGDPVYARQIYHFRELIGLKQDE